MSNPIDYPTKFFGYLGPDTHHRFYVYLLLRPNGKPFYVGKGTGNRIAYHESEARNKKCQCHKCKVIRKIWRSGQEVGRQIIFSTSDEMIAYQVEAYTIQRFRNQLVNVYDCDPRLEAPQKQRRETKKEREAQRLAYLRDQLRDLKQEKRYTNLTGDLEERARLQAAIDAIRSEIRPLEQLRLDGI